MPRTDRMRVSDEKAVYHFMSRTALDGFPLQDVEKEFMLGMLKRFAGAFCPRRAEGQIAAKRHLYLATLTRLQICSPYSLGCR